ncbi:MAG: molecular chaperone DnaJ [Rhodospirillales bacterium]|nr:molecular chaperone DnaJ [Rhodospirillales bacterium]
MAKQDYYATLGVDRKANADDLKKAYRKLAMQCHPDRNPGDKGAEHRFKELSEAYDVLKDEQKRAAYDRFGHAAFEGGAGSGFGGFGTGFASGFADIFDEMFGDFVQGGRRTSGVMQGADLRYNLQITLEEAFAGKKTSLRVPTAVPCDSCRGTGSAAGTAPTACATCHGQGRVRSQSGFFTVERTCPNCQGAGQIIRNPCRTCAGAGRVQREKALAVQIPAGVEDGTRIRLAGEGEAGLRGGPPGDLYIFIGVSPHRIFQREGANIHCRVPIPMTTAALGGTITIPTVEGGRAQLVIPAGTPTGHQLRIKSKGMTVLHSKSRGDMFVHAIVETPVSLTKRQQDLLREFERDGSQATHSPQSHGFFHKMKELWEDLKE